MISKASNVLPYFLTALQKHQQSSGNDTNLLSIQVHNYNLNSSDMTLIPFLTVEDKNIEKFESFVMRNSGNYRPNNIRNQIQSQFNLPGQALVNLNVSPQNSGKIKLNTITPSQYNWSGTYFKK